MKVFGPRDIIAYDDSCSEIQLLDHFGGFDVNLSCSTLEKLKRNPIKVWSQYIVNDGIKKKYPWIDFSFDVDLPQSTARQPEVLGNYTPTVSKKLKNFICSFNGSDHVSRQFLTSMLYKFNLFNEEYCSKNFVYSLDRLDGNITQFVGDDERFYRKFFISDDLTATNFYMNVIGYEYQPFGHIHNMSVLEKRISESFVQIVSETIGDRYYPFVSEKFVYPLLGKTLWVGYAQPNYHTYLETHYGFKKYDKVFDYSFDKIENPVIRLVEMMSMLSKFEKLSISDWHDLYLIEQDTIEYNYELFRSKKYLDKLREYG
jgi:hypothetical protein